MDRRRFLYAILTSFVSPRLSTPPLSAEETAGRTSPKELFVIDAHAHPARILLSDPITLSSRAVAIEPLKELGAVTSSFSAVGDVKKGNDFYDRKAAGYGQVIEQLDRAKGLIEFVGGRIVRTSSDIPRPSDSGNRIGALLALEGADPLEKDPEKIEDLYRYGVRIVTPMHYRINLFGDIMTAPPKHNGLTKEGRSLIAKMQELGIVVDVAHAHVDTLKDIAEMTGKPLIDSHTALTYSSAPTGGRSRTWKEMEMVVKTGGIVCTWLLAIKTKTVQRETFLDWAKEIKTMKERFGIEHVGLGTDTGGYFKNTRLIEGYRNLLDVAKLADAMIEVGLTKTDITAFMAGNLSRVLKECIG